MISGRAVLWTLGALAVGLGTPGEVRAALGGDRASIAADEVTLSGTRLVTAAAGWEVHELHLPSGAVVREYLSQSGKVFAIAWAGPVIPNLRLLLGPYFEPYVHSPRKRPSGHHLRVVTTPEWVVQSAGHPQGFVGRAWLPTHLPPSFVLDTVRAW
jgi:hypothetical protein